VVDVQDPAAGVEVHDLIDGVAQELDVVAADEEAPRAGAVAGTATTLAAAALGLETYDSEAINGTSLSLETVQRTAQMLRSMTRQERAELGYMHPGRVDVIGAGVTIYARILTRLNEITDGVINSVTVSEHDILDGIALSQL